MFWKLTKLSTVNHSMGVIDAQCKFINKIILDNITINLSKLQKYYIYDISKSTNNIHIDTLIVFKYNTN